MKFLHLYIKEKELFQGHENFLHFFLRCTVKTHAEGVAESMGSVMDLQSDKRRGLSIEDIGKETLVHWNGPPVHLADSLGEKSLNRMFKGRPWHFVTRRSNVSTVMKRISKKLEGAIFLVILLKHFHYEMFFLCFLCRVDP